jgi:predicted nucleotidyltransferase
MKFIGKGSALNKLLQKAEQDTDVLAVILFGSSVRGEEHSLSDIDICIVLLQNKHDPVALSHKRLEYLSICDFDIHIYQQLPIYLRHRIIKEGRVLFCRNEDMLYDSAFKTAQEFEDYKHIYHEYLEKVARA